jgi:chemotaxis protein MotB
MGKDNKMDANSWMVTFGDLVMLLLTFFVLLLTMSSMDNKKLEDLFTHFREATGVLEFSGYKELSNLATFVKHYNNSDSMIMIDHNRLLQMVLPSSELKKNIEKVVADIDKKINIAEDEKGIILSFQDNLLFDEGKVNLKKEIFPILDTIAYAIEDCFNDILIMGHTDDRPIKNALYQSNWELSVYRGLSVLEYFIESKGLSSSRFMVGGCGSSRPLYPNDTEKHRAINRRVEIIFRNIQEG